MYFGSTQRNIAFHHKFVGKTDGIDNSVTEN